MKTLNLRAAKVCRFTVHGWVELSATSTTSGSAGSEAGAGCLARPRLHRFFRGA